MIERKIVITHMLDEVNNISTMKVDVSPELNTLEITGLLASAQMHLFNDFGRQGRKLIKDQYYKTINNDRKEI